MKSSDIVKEIMKQRGHTFESLASAIGYVTEVNGKKKGRANMVSERLRGKQEMRVDTLIKMLDAMDCNLIIQSRLTDKTKWEVTLDPENI